MKTASGAARAFALMACLAGASSAPAADAPSRGPRILLPQRAEPAEPKFERVQPAPENRGHFVARTEHLIEFARKNPAPPHNPPSLIGGIKFWPAEPITEDALRVVDAERAKLDRGLRDRSLLCGTLVDAAAAKIIHVDAREGGVSVPVFLTGDSYALRYFELSIDEPDGPVQLMITGYNGVAPRITASARTQLTRVHVETYYPSVVLGVDPARVTQQYLGRKDRGCTRGALESERLASLHRVAVETKRELRYRLGMDRGYQVAIGAPQPATRGAPRLGNFLDPNMPLPNTYGIAVLQHLGYLRRLELERGVIEGGHGDAFEILKPFRIPEGLGGAHSVVFVASSAALTPSGNLLHSVLVRPRRQ